jgi:hypothetical protein
MNYNYNYNQYGQYPYNYTQYQQPQQQMQMQPQQMQQQTQYIPLTFVSGIEGAKAFIVAPNQTVYLRDSDTETLFIKTADAQGRYTLKTYNLTPTDGVNKINNNEFATISELNALKREFEEKMNKLSLDVEKLIGGKNNE